MDFRKIIFALVLGVVVLLPLVSAATLYFGFIFTKSTVFLVLTEVAVIFWLPIFFKQKLLHNKPGILNLMVLVYFAVIIVSMLRAEDVQQSIWSSYERMLGLWVLAHICIFYFIVTTTVREEGEWLWIFRAWSFTALIVALVPFFQSQNPFGIARVGSTLGNATFLASYLLLSFFVTMALLLRESKFSYRAVFFACVLLFSFLALMLTGTRGAMLALVIGAVLTFAGLAFLLSKEGKTLSMSNTVLRKVALGILIFIFCASLGIYFIKDSFKSSSYGPLRRIASISLSDKSFQGRLMAWRVAWNGWRERPFFGWGPENFGLLFNAYYDARLVNQEPWFDRAHNFIFDVGATTGILGLLAYCGIFVAAFLLLIKQKKKKFWLFLAFGALLVAYLFQNILVFDSTTTFVLLFVVFAFIGSRSDNEKLLKTNQYTSSWSILAVGFIVVAPIFYLGTWKPFWENRIGKLGYDAFAEGSDAAGEKFTEQALLYNTYGNIDVRRGVAEYTFEFLKKGGKRNPEALKRLLDYSIRLMEDNIHERPKDVKWYMYQGQLYNLRATILGSPDREYAAKAEKRFLEAAVISPNRMQIYLEIAQARKVQGNISGMWSAIDTAENLVPEYGIPHINGLVHAIELGDRSRETEELAWLDGHSVSERDSIRDAYYQARRFDEAALAELYLIKNKEQGDYDKQELAGEYKNLAVFYKEAGKFEDARKAALRVIELDPSQKSSAEVFLQSLGK